MDRAGEVGEALDVDQPRALRGGDARVAGDAARPAELDRTGVEDRQRVDLPHHRALRRQPRVAGGVFAFGLLLREVVALPLHADGALDVVTRDRPRAFLVAQVRGLAREVADLAVARDQAVAAAGGAGAVLGDGGEAGRRERAQLLGLGQPREVVGVAREVPRLDRDRRVELGVDLEDLRELRVLGGQLLVHAGLADQHDLEVERDRLGLQRADLRARRLVELADLQAAALQRALELRPHARLAQDVEAAQHQVTAVGAQQRAGGDVDGAGARAVGRRRDRAEQVAERRVRLQHDGARVVERRLDDAGVELAEPRRGRRLGRGLFAVLVAVAVGGYPLVEVALEVLAGGVEPVGDLGLVPAALELLLVQADDLPSELPVHRPQLLEQARVLIAHAVVDLVEAFDQLLAVPQQLVALGLADLAFVHVRQQRVERVQRCGCRWRACSQARAQPRKPWPA